MRQSGDPGIHPWRGKAGAERRPVPRTAAGIAAALLCAACAQVPPGGSPPGDEKSAKTRVLEAGARLLQAQAPLRPMDIYLVGFHPMKDDPAQQMEAHHYCHQINEDFAQCVLFDGNTAQARLNGIEYIVSEKLFATLPQAERKLWHPHNGEILSGQLVAPGIPDVAEKALMKSKVNSYGKTWHVWDTGSLGKSGDPLPLGPPMLAWSFNRDGEAVPELVEQRDRRMGVDSSAKRAERSDLTGLARPQSGVDALKGRFGRPTADIPGVTDAAAATAVPAR
ncbi:OBAP family protein [Azohydromonas lata]|uniref:OBAP family protein n=1 Tax=Azohydromonas lata TaxID=45677 RepID=UPI000A04EAA8|nr:OBAP family protein [Azohydromonas lata]